jgi:hypothetical protein
LGWNATALARRLGMARERSATEWLNGRRPSPQPVADWLDLMYRHEQTAPPPPTPPRS